MQTEKLKSNMVNQVFIETLAEQIDNKGHGSAPVHQTMDSERRIFDRFQARFPVKFKDTRGDFGNDVFLKDASFNGVNILTKNSLFLNDRIALEVEVLDGNDPLLLSGRVMWSKPINESSMWDIGLQFDEVDPMKMQRIFKYNPAF